MKSKINFGILDFNGMVYSGQLTTRQIINDLFDSSIAFSMADKNDAAHSLTNTRLFGNGSVMYLGISYQDEKFGGLAFNVRERLVWHSVFNQNVANFLFLGWQDTYFDQKITNPAGDTLEAIADNSRYVSDIYRGTDLHYLHTREFNLGYGGKVLDLDGEVVVYAGIGFKYNADFGGLQYYQKDNGQLYVFSVFSPFYEDKYDDPTPSAVEGTGLKQVGTGFGFDIGTTVQLFDDIKISLAVNDIGSIKWDGNVYEGNDVRVYGIETRGINNYNLFKEGMLISFEQHPEDPNKWNGLENKTIGLPTNFRAGASYRISEAIEAGIDFYAPLGEKVPGVMEAPVLGLGVNFEPIPLLQLSMGVVSGAKLGTRVPLGVVLRPL
jgi:hypothetical protein